MIATNPIAQIKEAGQVNINPTVKYKIKILKGWTKIWIELRVMLHLFVLALKTYGSLVSSFKVLKGLYLLKKAIMGRTNTKIVQVDTKYYFQLYVPGFPSKVFDEYMKGEFNRIVPFNRKSDALGYVFFAITKKCPLRCEHCLEWDNLNKKESLDLDDLKAVVRKFQQNGLAQFHLSGGEPLARIKDLEELIGTAAKQSEFYVLTSGFNFTVLNAKILKEAGLTGIVISLDHFDAEKHNSFRGLNNSFEQVKSAIKNSQQQNLVVALTICVTKAFISLENLIQYAEFAKNQKVVFVQLLEPKAVGHYKGLDVFLSKSELDILEQFYEMMSFNPRFKDYPIVIYHGYHQRRLGCMFGGGNRGLYIDSEGYVNACPFCHTKNFNIKDAIWQKEGFQDFVKVSKCPTYKSSIVC